MNDLFEKLKTEPAVNSKFNALKTSEVQHSSPDCTSNAEREDSMPPPSTTSVVRKSLSKSRSISPRAELVSTTNKVSVGRKSHSKSRSSSPKAELPPTPSTASVVRKSLSKSRSSSPNAELGSTPSKVGIKRKSHSKSRSISPKAELITTPSTSSELRKSLSKSRSNSINEEPIAKATINRVQSPTDTANNQITPPKAIRATTESSKKITPSSKKITPTKAQQKLFDSDVLSLTKEKDVPQAKVTKIMKCKVLLKRLPANFQNVYKQKASKRTDTESAGKKHEKAKKIDDKVGRKRKDESKESPTAQNKRGRPSNVGGFFIKISPPQSKSAKEEKAHKEKVKKLNFKATLKTGPKKSKFMSRSQLFKKYGTRFFKSYVRIERCKHPLMVVFEENARLARNQQRLKRANKSKNLSVSFREQIEIFGESDSDANDTTDGKNSSLTASAANKVVTPARLERIENGVVVQDILLDSSLYVDPNSGKSSTPINTSARKKRGKKSFSPLKDESTSSARKERLKLANEKLPPHALGRVNMDEDDDDDECEYIVPIDIPIRRPSNAQSNNVTSTAAETEAILPDSIVTEANNTTSTTEENDSEVVEPADSSSSFASAQEEIENKDAVSTNKNNIDAVSNKLKDKQDKIVAAVDAASPSLHLDETIEKKNADKVEVADSKHLAENTLADSNKVPNDKAKDTSLSTTLDDITLDLFDGVFAADTNNLTPTILTEERINNVEDIVQETIGKLCEESAKKITETDLTEEN